MTQEKCHFIGIGGIGMSGLARILLSRDTEVTGSDLASSYVTEGLVREGAKVFIGHAPTNISAQSTVVYTTGIKKDNPEFQAAHELKCRMMHRSDLLLELMQGYKTLAVAGTHGKTTTSGLLAWVLHEAGLEPAFAVGGMIPQFQSNGAHGKGEYFVAEADESDGTFLKYHPHGAIVTNIGLDHMDFYGAEATLLESFKTFMSKIRSPGHLFWCGDDARLVALKRPGVRYGFQAHNDLVISHLRQEGWSITYDITFQGKTYSDIEVALVGKHNALNSAAVFGLALSVGADETKVRAALKSFGGVGRRCDKKGEEGGVLVLDDYAHHPTEIKTTLEGIRRAIGERRLIAVFQPHRYTRTRDCLGSYNGIFDAADSLIITDIHAAGESPLEGVTPQAVGNELKHPYEYVSREKLAEFLSDFVRPHDVVVTLGAGNITQVGPEFLERLKKKSVS